MAAIQCHVMATSCRERKRLSSFVTWASECLRMELLVRSVSVGSGCQKIFLDVKVIRSPAAQLCTGYCLQCCAYGVLMLSMLPWLPVGSIVHCCSSERFFFCTCLLLFQCYIFIGERRSGFFMGFLATDAKVIAMMKKHILRMCS